MAIVVYKCDVCKREKDFLRNIEGLEKVQRCTITHGCRGKLYQVKVLPDYIRASKPSIVLGLDDWRQRKVLYNHTQSIARDTWIIKHNLGTFPSISVFVNVPTSDNPENTVEITPVDILVVDDDNITLVFDRSWAGAAQLVARQSDPNLLKPYTRLVPSTTSTLHQLSNKGEVTVATLISTIGTCADIQLDVSYKTTKNETVYHTYTSVSDTLPNTVSPWRDYNKVIIKGKTYTIRTYQGIYPSITDDTVGSGSTFEVIGVSPCSGSGRPPQRGEVYFLVANKPFELVDKDTSKYIDVFDATAASGAAFSLLYNEGEFFATGEVVRTTYPPIRKI